MFPPIADHLPHLLNTFREISHRRTVGESHEIDALALLKVSNSTWVYVKKYSRDTNDVVLHTFLEETKAKI